MTHATTFAIGPGNTAVATYDNPSTGEETYLTANAESGLPPVEYQLVMRVRQAGIRAEDVKAVHTDLSPSMLPGGYTLALLSGAFPNAKLSCTHQYGKDAAERAASIDALTQHAAMMNQLIGVAAPAKLNRAPVPANVPPAPPAPDQMLGSQLVEVFGPQGVYRIDGNVLQSSQLVEPAKYTLALAGLPIDIPLFFTANRPDKPLPGGFLADAATYLRAIGGEANERVFNTLSGHVVIGTDGSSAITVQCNNNPGMPTSPGQVWAVPNDAMGLRVNASVAQFVRSLRALAILRQRVAGLGKDAVGAELAAFQQHLIAVDSTALENPGTWWSLIVEQMWHGLF